MKSEELRVKSVKSEELRVKVLRVKCQVSSVKVLVLRS